jgi:hypothetical protein
MLRRTLPWFLLAALAAGCHPAASLQPTPATASWTGPTGMVALSVALQPVRRVQWVESYRATKIVAEVSGAGLAGWTLLTPVDGTTGEFGPMGVDGLRTASLAAAVPAGDRRVFRVKVYDAAPEPDVLLTELWGVGDVPANTTLQRTYPVSIKPMTTPTGRIFDRLLRVDAAKALTLPIENVQHFVEELLNTNWITGDTLRAASPQVHPALLDIDQATAAIIRGNNGVPFQIPVPIPEALLARDPANPLQLALTSQMQKRGQVRARAVDIHGRAVARPLTFFVTDPASLQQQASATVAADVTLPGVVPGAWEIVATDLERGTTARKPVTVVADQVADATVVIAPSTEPVAGAYNAEADVETSFNGENVPARFVYTGALGGFVADNGLLTFVDAGNQRLRQFSEVTAPGVVNTLAGTGQAAIVGDGGQARQAALTMTASHDVAVDRHGVTYVTQSGNSIRAIGTDGLIRTFWKPSGYQYSELTRLSYDPARHHLYAVFQQSGGVYRLDLNVFNGSNPALTHVSSANGQNGVFLVPIGEGGAYDRADVKVAGDYLFYAHTGLSGPGYIKRYHIPTGAIVTLVGQTPAGPAGEETPAAALSDRDYRGMALDDAGNMFVRGDAGVYRVSGATGADPRVKLLLAGATYHNLAFDRQTQRLYAQATQPFKNAAGTVRNVPVIQRVVP